MAIIKTTTREFKEGIALRAAEGTEVHWESTGHINVRLLDEVGEAPLAGRVVKVDVPGEGTIELTADANGRIAHPDVPFGDYELDLGDRVVVHVPAVANPGDLHERHVPGVRVGYAVLMVSDAQGEPLPTLELVFDGPESFTLVTDDDGMARDPTARAPGPYDLTTRAGNAKVTLSPKPKVITIVTLEPEEAP
jgi:hypothetical protein